MPHEIPHRLRPALLAQSEIEARKALIEPARQALARPGAVQRYGQTDHVTISALTEIASYLAVSVTTTEPRQTTSPSGRPAAVVQATAVRGDGVSATASGVCEQGEGRNHRMFSEWHACCGMAETRARSRALTALLSPILVQADPSLSISPIETMPDDGRIRARHMGDLLAACEGDKALARDVWDWHLGDDDDGAAALSFAAAYPGRVAEAFAEQGRATERAQMAQDLDDMASAGEIDEGV